MAKQRQWALTTKRSSYVISMLDGDQGLVLDHWGASLPYDVVTRWDEPDRSVQYRFFEDAAPMEYASMGARQTAFSELVVDRGSGSVGASWTWVPAGTDGATLIEAEDVTTLRFDFTDETATLEMRQYLEVSTHHDVIRRWVSVSNHGAEPVTLDRVFSAGWSPPIHGTVRVHYLAGAWSQEFQPQDLVLSSGTFMMGSRAGVTGLSFSPTVCVEPADSAAAGGAYGVSLEWSGSWRLQVEKDLVDDRLRVSCGIDDDATRITLLTGETFTSPTSSGVWSEDGSDGVSRSWHEYQRCRRAASLDPRRHPIVYNSWFATGFGVDLEGQLALARRAARVGAEAFVVDDGWFSGRNDDTGGLGDWEPDPTAFPAGLAPLACAVRDLGMCFGVWVEPEAVSPDSRLFRDHPDWIYQAAHRPPRTLRHQYVLDLGRAEAAEWVDHMLHRLLTSADIGYLKWDMNRPISDGGRPGDLHGREWSVQHTRNYYRILRMLRADFPDVIVEGCAAGGGRIDNAVLSLVDNVWPSDETGPRDRLAIQHGFLSAYPPHAMSSWVTDEPGMRQRCAVSVEFRFAVAMCGVLGIGADLSGWADAQLARARHLVDLYRSIRPTVFGGAVFRHGTPGDTTYAVEFADTGDGCCIFVFDRDSDRVTDRPRVRVRPRSLRADLRYRVHGGDIVVSGAEAGSVGVPVPFALARDVDVMIFDPVT